MNNLAQILNQAQSSDLGVRRQALEYLESEGKTNPGGLFVSFSRMLAQDANQDSRIQAALYIKSKIKFYWEQICQVDQKSIRDNCLSSLGDCSCKVVNMGANAVSALACLEIPKGKWTEVIDVLVNSAQSSNSGYKFAAMVTIGYICEEIGLDCFGMENQDRVLEVIVKGLMCEEVRIVEQALKILKFAAWCFVKNFEKGDEGEWILRAIYNSFPSSPYLCLQVLCEIMNCCPQAFTSNLATLGTLTYTAIASQDEKISTIAIEVWNIAGDIEENRQIYKKPQLNYLKTACKTLTSLILPKLFFEYVEDEWTCCKSAYSTLASMAHVCPGDNFPEIFDFIKKNLSDPCNKQALQGGLLALAAIFEADLAEKGEIFEEFFTVCVKLLENNGREVKFALRSVEKMILNGNARVSKEILNDLIMKLKKIVLKVDKSLPFAVSCMGSVVKKYKLMMDMNEYQLILRFLTDQLNSPNFKEDSNIQYIFSVLQTAFEEIPDQFSILYTIFYPEYFEIYLHSLNTQQIFQLTKKSQIFQLICANLPMHKISPDDMKLLINKTISIGIEKLKIVEESLQFLGALAMNSGCTYSKFYSQVSPYIIHYLSILDSPETLKSAILAAGDMARALGPGFIESVSIYLPHLLSIMENAELPITCKILTINCLGDIAGAVKAGFLNVMPKVLKYLDEAAGISLDLNFEMQTGESLIELRECIVQFYVGLVQGLFECSQHLVIKDRVLQLCEYLLLVVQDVYCPSELLHENVFMLVLDMLNYYRDKQLGARFVQYVSKFLGQNNTMSQNAKYILGLIEIS